ncbi:aminotransferase class V-fold PLP-dependent enzyme [Marinilongibacter aquaticus]|uniref:aminotransferase class V-fold PLP-dependent enzyme n=1 Tax=Marinilongibacter aquaticus TaxID=2975157 RepID=UPI0021BD7A15|nr:aminotransferase class V-fold PLP-dependent enzyme [Marinilongibacter aquaticus]UBM58595.1 aminotransferase class V-fold PLP-dependent enzyme [Marinilongibacter aquaticus]
MKTNRRDFINLLSISPFALKSIPSNFSTQEKNDSEAYWEDIRKKFPLTHNRIYMNNGTFGPSPKPVLDSLKTALDQSNTSGEYGHTDEFRQVLAHFVGVKENEISLTHNTTEGINIVCWAIPLQAGDEVIISLHEHVGNALPWLNRAKIDGLTLKTFEPGATQEETFSRIKSLITTKTKVIAIPHISCTLGQVFPVREIAALARKKGIFTAIDGAHGSGTFDLDLKDLGCDFYATSCHKWMLGPNGSGFLYINEALLPDLQALQVGAYSDAGWDLYSNPPEIKGYNPTAHRFDYGSQSMPLYAAAAASAEFHQEIGKQVVEKRVKTLSSYLFEGLAEMKGKLKVLTPEEAESRICMVTFKPLHKKYQEFAQMVSKEGFRIRQVPESHLDAIRISTHIYNSKAEIDLLLKAIEKHV